MMSPAAILMGGARTIRHATALRLARHGLTVAIFDRDAAELRTSADALAEIQRSFLPVVLESGGDESFGQALDHVLARCGRIEALVIGLDQDGPSGMEDHFAGLTSIIRSAKCLASAMAAQGGGRIVHLLSSAGRYRSGYFSSRTANSGDWAATEGAVLAHMRQLSLELAPRGVRVNAVAAGHIEGAVGEAEWLEASPGDRRAIMEEISVGRRGTPDEVAAVVEFLASEASSYVTGATIDVNGGWWMS